MRNRSPTNKTCDTCAKCLRVKRYHYRKNGGVDHIPTDEFVCTAFAHEGVAIWMTGDIDRLTDVCEEWTERKVSN